MEANHSGANAVELLIKAISEQIEWPTSIKDRFAQLKLENPIFWDHMMAAIPETFKLDEIIQVLRTDKAKTHITVDTYKLRELMDTFVVRLIETIESIDDDEFDEFIEDIMEAVWLALMHIANPALFDPNGLAYSMAVAKEQAILAEIAHGKNEQFERIVKLADFTIAKIQKEAPTSQLQGFSLSEERFPYPISERYNATACVGCLYDFFVDKGRLSCSLHEFENHIIYGDVSKKLVWNDRTLEIAWFHKLLTGSYKKIPGIEFLKTNKIHVLAARHFVDEFGKELNVDVLNSALAKYSFHPDNDDFIVAYSRLLKSLPS